MPKKSPVTSMLDQKLKTSDPHVKKYVTQLEFKIAKLETENSRLKVENMRLNISVKALESEIKERLKTRQEERKEIEEKAAELALTMLKPIRVVSSIPRPPNEHGEG